MLPTVAAVFAAIAMALAFACVLGSATIASQGLPTSVMYELHLGAGKF